MSYKEAKFLVSLDVQMLFPILRFCYCSSLQYVKANCLGDVWRTDNYSQTGYFPVGALQQLSSTLELQAMEASSTVVHSTAVVTTGGTDKSLESLNAVVLFEKCLTKNDSKPTNSCVVVLPKVSSFLFELGARHIVKSKLCGLGLVALLT